MIREGRAAGWFALAPDAYLSWASLNGVELSHVAPGVVAGRGGALVASETLRPESSITPLMTVPRELILSLERVKEHSKTDRDYREVLESLSEFGTTPRGAILSFLLVQASITCPDLPEHVAVRSPFTDYVKSLPEEFLPTFWSDHELQLLTGTTLAPAVSAKLKSLQREYDLLCMAAAETSWYRSAGNIILLDDWYQVDAMYRSRALDYPEIGHCMVPCVDLANHASGEATGALYEKDASGNAVLLLRDGRSISKGDEVTITYGDDKGACEMLFSYGFLEDDRASASTLFLSLSIPSDDPYSSAKSSIADCAPGFKLTILDDGVFDWTGDFIWLMCVSHEDGLHLEVARTVDGNGEEMQATYDGQEVHGGAAHLRERLQSSDLWNVYQLRAVALLQQRVYDQLQVLFTTQEELEATPHGSATDVRAQPYQQAMQLRRLEFELLEQAYEHFETQKLELAATEVVQQYLAKMNSEAEAEEDFS